MEYIEVVLPDIETAASRVARKWPQVTTQDDLFQDLVVHFLERPGSLESLADLPKVERVKVLTRVGHEKCSGQRDSLDQFSGQFTYSVDEVRKLAERGAAIQRVAAFDAPSLDFQVSLELMKKRNRDYWSIIVERYVAPGETDRSKKDVLSRALESLTTLMNRARASQTYKYTNGGRFRNNKSALNRVDSDYEGTGRYDD